ncbi:hypothetical protein GF406_02485 [candidate division KSB1 bacterium]|jgi:hypothetical protein|nr:hypothetical protein [candidate division KSB1 bacterium]
MRPYIFIAAMTTLFWACNSQSPFTPKAQEHVSVRASIPIHPSITATNSLTSMELVVTADNMDTVRATLTLTSIGAEGQVTVPSGPDRQFTVTGYMGTLPVLQGVSEMDLDAGQTASLTVTMNYLISTIILSPPNVTVKRDSVFTVNLGARNVQNLAIFGARVQFDPTLLTVTDLGRRDSLLTSGGGSITQLEFSKNNSTGIVDVVLGIFPASNAVSGSGPIAEITFKALATGETTLQLITDPSVDSDLGLYDRTANEITSLALGNLIQIASP